MENNENVYIGRRIPSEKVGLIPDNAKWLSGEAGGAWFEIQKEEDQYRIKRYSLDGELDCDRIFNLNNTSDFDPTQPYEIKHTSHCAKVRTEQNREIFIFEWMGK